MVCLYLFLFAGGYFILYRRNSYCEPVDTQSGVLKFALLSLLALGLSFFLFSPGAISVMESGRMSGSSKPLWVKYIKFLQETGIDSSVKRIMLYCMFIPLIYLILISSAAAPYFFCPSKKKNECAIAFLWLVSIFALGIWLIRPAILTNMEDLSQIPKKLQPFFLQIPIYFLRKRLLLSARPYHIGECPKRLSGFGIQ